MFAPVEAPRNPHAQNDRKHFRLALNLPIDIVVPSAPVALPATLGDLSEGGCRIVCKSMLLRDSDIAFELKRDGKAPVKLTGKVMSVDYKQGNKMFHYGVRFNRLRPADSDAVYQYIVEQQRRAIKSNDPEQRAPAPGRPALRSVPERGAYRVEKMFAMRYSVTGLRGSTAAVAVDLSVGGMRIAFDRKQQIDRELDLFFTLPSDVLDVLTRHESSRDGSIFGRTVQTVEKKARAFTEIQLHAKLLPAMTEINGRFIYSVIFVRPSAFVQDELQRYVHAAQLTQLQKQRAGAAAASGTRLL